MINSCLFTVILNLVSKEREEYEILRKLQSSEAIKCVLNNWAFSSEGRKEKESLWQFVT